jgi:hypothetical protein
VVLRGKTVGALHPDPASHGIGAGWFNGRYFKRIESGPRGCLTENRQGGYGKNGGSAFYPATHNDLRSQYHTPVV